MMSLLRGIATVDTESGHKLWQFNERRFFSDGVNSHERRKIFFRVKQQFLSICILAPVLTLAGCSHFNTQEEVVAQPESEGKVYNSVKNIKCQPLRYPADKKNARVVVNEFTSRLKQSSGETPVLAFKLPETGIHKVAIHSYAVKVGNQEQLFYPEIALLDKSHNVIAHVPKSQIKYKKPGFSTPEGIEAQFIIDNDRRSSEQAVCMLIYTTDDLRKGETTLINEAKEYAKAYGVVAPPIPDPVADHGNNGHLDISIKSSDIAFASVPVAPVAATALVLPNALPAKEDGFSKEVRQHYVDAVNEGLKSGSISKALDARSELRGIVRATEGYFVSQYGKPVDQLSRPKAADGKDGYAGKVLYHYQEQVADHLKSGQGAAALQAVDQIKGIQDEVDQLFNK